MESTTLKQQALRELRETNHCPSFRSGSKQHVPQIESRPPSEPLICLLGKWWAHNKILPPYCFQFRTDLGDQEAVLLVEAVPGTVPVLLISTSKQSTFFFKHQVSATAENSPHNAVVGELCSLHWNFVFTIACTSWSFIFKSTVPEGGKRWLVLASQPHLSPGLEQCKHDCVRLCVYVFSMTSRLNLLCLQVGDTFSNRWHCRLQWGPEAPAGLSLLAVILLYNISLVPQQDECPAQQWPRDTGFSELNRIKMPRCGHFKL